MIVTVINIPIWYGT